MGCFRKFERKYADIQNKHGFFEEFQVDQGIDGITCLVMLWGVLSQVRMSEEVNLSYEA